MTSMTSMVGAALLASSCGSEDRPDQEVLHRDSSGIQIIHHTGADRALDWTVEPVWRIGGAADERILIGRVRSGQIARDDQGRVFILNALDRRVIVLSSDGEITDTIARPGTGPGELNNPLALDARGDRELVVYDRGKAALIHWRGTEAAPDEVRIQDFVWGPRLRLTSGGLFYVSLDRTAGGEDVQALKRWSGGEADHIVAFTPQPATSVTYPSCPEFRPSAPPFFAPDLIWDADGEGRVATVTTAGYRIDIMEGSQVVRSLRRDLDPITVNERQAAARLALQLGDGLEIRALNCLIPTDELVRARGFSRTLPFVEDLVFGPGGELWVLRRGDAMTDVVDVFGRDGAYLGTLPRLLRSPSGCSTISTGLPSGRMRTASP